MLEYHVFSSQFFLHWLIVIFKKNMHCTTVLFLENTVFYIVRTHIVRISECICLVVLYSILYCIFEISKYLSVFISLLIYNIYFCFFDKFWWLNLPSPVNIKAIKICISHISQFKVRIYPKICWFSKISVLPPPLLGHCLYFFYIYPHSVHMSTVHTVD